MEITKVIALALVAVFISLALKQYKSEFSIYISLGAGIIILFYVLQKLSLIIDLLQGLADKIDINAGFVLVLLKITGIAYISDFASNICKDAGETAIASKVEFAGRILIIALAIPIISTMLEMMMKLI